MFVLTQNVYISFMIRISLRVWLLRAWLGLKEFSYKNDNKDFDKNWRLKKVFPPHAIFKLVAGAILLLLSILQKMFWHSSVMWTHDLSVPV